MPFAVSALALAFTPPPPLAIAFTPGGLLFPFYVGVAYELRALRKLTPSTPLGGSSAGAIVATAVACGVSERRVRSGLADLVVDVRGGARLNVALRKQLELLLPDDAPARAEAHALSLGYFEVLPWPGRRIVTSWTSKADLIDVVCASCGWPLFFSRWPFVRCRRSWAIDGYFSVPRSRFGCPPLTGAQTLAVTCLPRISLSAFDAENVIQPGALRYVSEGLELPVADSQWFRWALEPASDEQIDAMVDLGREHARCWARAQDRRSS